MAVQNIVRTFAGMKQLRLLIVASVLMLLVGCLQDKVGGVRIYSDPSVELYSIPNQVSMFLFHASGPWTATSPDPWLQVMKESGPGGTDEVTQRDEYAEFDQEEFSVPAEGGMMEVTFKTNAADSLQLYVTGSLAQYLEDTRKKDSTKNTRADERKAYEGNLKWLRVLPNTDTVARKGFFYLAIGVGNNRHVSLDTLNFYQEAFVPDSLLSENP